MKKIGLAVMLLALISCTSEMNNKSRTSQGWVFFTIERPDKTPLECVANSASQLNNYAFSCDWGKK